MSIRNLALSGAILVLTVGPAHAADDVPVHARNGVYLGVGATVGFDAFDPPGGDVSLDKSLGVNARVGYRFHQRFSAELEYEWLEGFELSGVSPSTEVFEGWVGTANLKAHLSPGKIQPYLLTGVGVYHLRSKGSDNHDVFTARMGMGLDYYFTEHVYATAGATYVLGTGPLKDADFVSVDWGAGYRF